MHDRSRAARIDPLLSNLFGRPSGFLTPDERAHIVVDGTGTSPWHAMKLAIASGLQEGARRGATHLLLLEDDAEPVPGALLAMARAIEARPDDPLWFFATVEQAGVWMDDALAHGASWCLIMDRPVGTLATVLPLPLARAFLEYSIDEDAALRPVLRGLAGTAAEEAGDTRLWWWLTRHQCLAQVVSARSLVEHGCAEPHESVLGRSLSRRAAHNLATPEQAAQIDWHAGIEPVVAARRVREQRMLRTVVRVDLVDNTTKPE